ncbi:hypothetical protein CEXT_285421 [Caerostris extrusa]|uniref:Uncharacterized protein n=1 Tax=Caerostris extrusa TaxID=172846 RepID=A0AAV4SN01_CAEEX|nr:hypothetical protein CEXT_285421 [Caerostris extrusa]
MIHCAITIKTSASLVKTWSPDPHRLNEFEQIFKSREKLNESMYRHYPCASFVPSHVLLSGRDSFEIREQTFYEIHRDLVFHEHNLQFRQH